MKIFIAGGAGFIGSHCVAKLLSQRDTTVVTVFDNLSSGRRWHLAQYEKDSRFRMVIGNIQDMEQLVSASASHDIVIHLASNPDIARAVNEPTIDFYQGTILSQNVFEAARINKIKKIIYASGSGVFGDDPSKVFTEEDYSARPTSTYAASKIAGEALLSSYCHMFGLVGVTFRFANVVGPNQTHGVAYDFINRLLENPHELTVLGDGTQTKSYIHVDDIVDGLLVFKDKTPTNYDMFNLTTEDSLTVREIAQIVISEMKLNDVMVHYGNESRGWVGDVPRIRFSSEKIKRHGWAPSRNSNEAMKASVRGMIKYAKAGAFAHTDEAVS